MAYDLDDYVEPPMKGDEPAKPVTEAIRDARSLAWLDEHLGPGDERLQAFLLSVVNGTATMEGFTKDGRPTTKRPTFSDRILAADKLRTYHRGTPTQKVEVTAQRSKADLWDPDKLELEEIRELRRLQEKATIQGEFTVAPEDETP